MVNGWFACVLTDKLSTPFFGIWNSLRHTGHGTSSPGSLSLQKSSRHFEQNEWIQGSIFGFSMSSWHIGHCTVVVAILSSFRVDYWIATVQNGTKSPSNRTQTLLLSSTALLNVWTQCTVRWIDNALLHARSRLASHPCPRFSRGTAQCSGCSIVVKRVGPTLIPGRNIHGIKNWLMDSLANARDQ